MRTQSFSLDADRPEEAAAVMSGLKLGRPMGQSIPCERPSEGVYFVSAFVLAFTGSLASRFNNTLPAAEDMHVELINEAILQLQTLAGSAKPQEVDGITTHEDHVGINGAPPPQPISSLFKRR